MRGSLGDHFLVIRIPWLKPDIMARHNVIYIMAWCARDNPLGKVVPGSPDRANRIWGRCFLTKG